MTTEITIEHQKLDQLFVDSWIENDESTIEEDRKIDTITIKDSQLFDNVSYNIFKSFVNIKELNVLNSNLNSKSLHRLLRGINPYSLSRLNLSGSKFSSFSAEDLISLNGLFSLPELVLPSDIDEHSQKILKKVLNVNKIIN
jgi:hypothetical protein